MCGLSGLTTGNYKDFPWQALRGRWWVDHSSGLLQGSVIFVPHFSPRHLHVETFLLGSPQPWSFSGTSAMITTSGGQWRHFFASMFDIFWLLALPSLLHRPLSPLVHKAAKPFVQYSPRSEIIPKSVLIHPTRPVTLFQKKMKQGRSSAFFLLTLLLLWSQ